MMKAVSLVEKDVTKVIDVPKPTADELGADDILVNVKYSALDTAVDSMFEKDFFAGFMHDMKSKPLLAGYHYSGIVEAVGVGVESVDIAK